MGKLIGAAAALIVGLALAAGGSLTLVNVSDPDSTPAVQANIQKQVNPNANKDTVYGSR